MKANLDVIPMLITAQTGYVGIRVPNHPVAQNLIHKSGLPIAAPSANKFGHVSNNYTKKVLVTSLRVVGAMYLVSKLLKAINFAIEAILEERILDFSPSTSRPSRANGPCKQFC